MPRIMTKISALKIRNRHCLQLLTIFWGPAGELKAMQAQVARLKAELRRTTEERDNVLHADGLGPDPMLSLNVDW
jgi:hypothetical protein